VRRRSSKRVKGERRKKKVKGGKRKCLGRVLRAKREEKKGLRVRGV